MLLIKLLEIITSKISNISSGVMGKLAGAAGNRGGEG